MILPILTMTIQREDDVVSIRRRAHQLAELLGYELLDQTRIAAAVSEIARNAIVYSSRGSAEFAIDCDHKPQMLQICIRDTGPGIADVKRVLGGESSTGAALGILSAQRLMDRFEVTSTPDAGAAILMAMELPVRREITSRDVSIILEKLSQLNPQSLLEEIAEQNRVLLKALKELEDRRDELQLLNREMEDTNRGVVALYNELEDKAERLRLADELKSKFLSHMSHEFRTPLNSIMALSGILLDRMDGELSHEQEVQIGFIRKGAGDLFELVNDLLDLAKMEAGRVEVHPNEFSVADLFGALRGMLRPLLVKETVHLVFEEPGEEIPTLCTDEGKVGQILRNFISNALKFTEKGEVRVSVRPTLDRNAVSFSVSDTGIGIPIEHQEEVFLEFTQVNSAIQKKLRGTGLGLPLSRKLAELLGGSVSLVSEPGIGSTFSATIPVVYPAGGGV